MGRPALHLKVSKKDQTALKKLLGGGVEQVRVTLRAVALQRLGEGMSAPQIAAVLPLTRQSVRNLARRYQQGGLERALYDKQRPGQPVCFRPNNVSASSPWFAATRPRAAPAGRCDWSPKKPSSDDWSLGRAEKRFVFCSSATTSSRGGKKMWCVAELNEAYIACMEDVLETYERPYDSTQPMICFDEKPVTLHADVRAPTPAEPGRKSRRDSEYERRGTANVFCAVEPKAGRHFTFVTPDRSGVEFAKALFEVALAYPEAEPIHLVMDNLSTHGRKSLTDLCGEEFGGEIWDCFPPHYTPKHGSWLNQAEIEIGLFSRQCLGKRRIPDLATLRREAAAWNCRVNRERVKIDWRFDRKTARRKFGYKRPTIKRSEN